VFSQPGRILHKHTELDDGNPHGTEGEGVLVVPPGAGEGGDSSELLGIAATVGASTAWVGALGGTLYLDSLNTSLQPLVPIVQDIFDTSIYDALAVDVVNAEDLTWGTIIEDDLLVDVEGFAEVALEAIESEAALEILEGLLILL
jgi:hypothetical protein